MICLALHKTNRHNDSIQNIKMERYNPVLKEHSVYREQITDAQEYL